VRRVGVEEEATFTGGVSRNVGMVKALEDVLGTTLNVSPEGHYIGALGAALFALERAQVAAAGSIISSSAPITPAGLTAVATGDA
jgi:(R)-2-hydroxyacyl-CoA dehydratese activating ATPase